MSRALETGDLEGLGIFDVASCLAIMLDFTNPRPVLQNNVDTIQHKLALPCMHVFVQLSIVCFGRSFSPRPLSAATHLSTQEHPAGLRLAAVIRRDHILFGQFSLG
jgi:hypothetical protein